MFYVVDMDSPIVCPPGTFIGVPPHVRHAFKNASGHSGKIFGMMMPGGAAGLEGFFRQIGVRVDRDEQVPDLDQPVEHLLEIILRLRSERH